MEREYFIRLPYYLFTSNPTHSLFSFDAWESQGRVACSHIMFPCSIETSTFSLSPYTLILSSLTRPPPSFCCIFLWSWHTSKLKDWQGRRLKAPIHLAGGIRLQSLSSTTSESSSHLFKYLASVWHPGKRERELKLPARRSWLKTKKMSVRGESYVCKLLRYSPANL